METTIEIRQDQITQKFLVLQFGGEGIEKVLMADSEEEASRLKILIRKEIEYFKKYVI